MTPPQAFPVVRAPARSIESVLASRWARLLIPSLSDMFFLAVLIWLFMCSGAAGWQGLLLDGDAGWHIRTGQYILDHHSVPHQDLYSFSKPGAPWYAWEWGSDVLFGWLERVAGLKGVVLFTGGLLATFATTLLRRIIWRGAHAFIGLAFALLSVGAASIHFLARPHVFTLLFLSVSVWLIESDRQRRSRRVWLLAPLTVLWTNLHGGFLALIALLGLCSVGAAVEALLIGGPWSVREIWSAREIWGGFWWRNAIRYGALALACAAASLVNPYGYQLHVHIYEYLRSDWIKNFIQEFMSPSFGNENMMQFEALLLLGLIAAGGFFRRKAVVEGLWILFLAHIALGGVRHVPLYAIVAGPLVAYEVGNWWKAWTRRAPKKSFPAIFNEMAADAASGFRRTSLWPVAVLVGLAFAGSQVPWPKDFPEIDFPIRLVHEHAAQILASRVLTTDQWADYLIYVNPKQKVFFDGRSDFYGPELGNQYIQLLNGGPDWRDLIEKYRFNLALLPREMAAAQLLKTQSDWYIAGGDDKRILLARSIP